MRRTNWTPLLRSLNGNKVALAIAELHRSETRMSRALLNIAEYHKVEHEIFHVARDIAGWSDQHVAKLADVGTSHGLDLAPEVDHGTGVIARAKQGASVLLGRAHEPSLLLIMRLRHVYREAAGVSLDWEVLAQTAQALKDRDLVAVTTECHPQTRRQLQWANAKLKELSPQAMVTG